MIIRRLPGMLSCGALVLAAAFTGAPLGGHAASTPALVKTAPASILVNAKGMTLYVFNADKPNASTCTGDCAKFWPPAELAAGATAPTAMTGVTGKFGTVARADGSKQLSFDGAPLYTFLHDKKAGDTNGQGLFSTWWTIAISPMNGTGAASGPIATAPGHLLVNAKGMTLYVFATDKPGKSACYNTPKDKCAKYWPALLVPSGMSVPTTMTGIHGKFGVAMRTDGTHQLTFDGAPLYTFLFDKKPGQVNGEGSIAGGYWWTVGV